jgi:rhamnosyl/mannosyltransferase
MKILHVFKTYLPETFGGIERVIWEIAEGAAARHGMESHVFHLSGEYASPQPRRIDHHWAHAARRDLDIASTALSFSAFGRFGALAREADIIHGHFPWPMMDLLYLASRTDRPLVLTYHSDIVRQERLLAFYAPLMHRLLGRAAAIVATSPAYARTSNVLARHRDRVSVIPIGLEPARLAPVSQERREAWRARLGDRFFLFVGLLRYYKGLPFLIEAARRTGLPVAIAGPGELEGAGPLPANVTLLGRVDDDDKAALLDLCAALVLPSHLRSEAFGVALLEAAFAGRAMISCEIGTGTSYVNLDGETGLVVPPADAQALAEAMQALWRDPARAAEFGAAARRRAERLFLARDMADAYCSLYRHCAMRHAP